MSTESKKYRGSSLCRIFTASIFFAEALLAGCGGTDTDVANVSPSGEGLHLVMAVGTTNHIDGIHFEITGVDCNDGSPQPNNPPIVIDKPISELRIPNGIPGLENHPLDEGSSHAFADYYQVVLPGCYDVETTPIAPNFTCYPAHESRVLVEAGKTTEVFLINQCEGTDPGAIDIISAINFPPVLYDVSFEDSKFVAVCKNQIVCATASDPENDPLEFVWEIVSGPQVSGPDVVSETKNANGSTTQCVRIVPYASGRVDLTVTVYDLLHENGNLVRIEDWLASHGYPHPSRASLDFFFYVTQSQTRTPCGQPPGFAP